MCIIFPWPSPLKWPKITSKSSKPTDLWKINEPHYICIYICRYIYIYMFIGKSFFYLVPWWVSTIRNVWWTIIIFNRKNNNKTTGPFSSSQTFIVITRGYIHGDMGIPCSLHKNSGWTWMNHGTRPGKQRVCELENGPVEIVDLPWFTVIWRFSIVMSTFTRRIQKVYPLVN